MIGGSYDKEATALIASSFSYFEDKQFFLISSCIQLSDSAMIDKLYASPSGDLVIVETRLKNAPACSSDILEQLMNAEQILAGWRSSDLDAALEDHLYETVGQAANLGEIMVRNGAFSFSGVRSFDGGVTVSLFKHVPVLFLSSADAADDTKRISQVLASECDVATATQFF